MKRIVKTPKAPEAIGPYSQAVRAGTLLFISGQIPLNAEGEMVKGGIEEQTVQVMENLKAILEAVDLTLDSLVKTTVYLRSLDDFAVFNRVYGGYFRSAHPARACVEVRRLPKDVAVEVEAIADSGG